MWAVGFSNWEVRELERERDRERERPICMQWTSITGGYTESERERERTAFSAGVIAGVISGHGRSSPAFADR